MTATTPIRTIALAALCALACAGACGDGSSGTTTSGLPALDPEPTEPAGPPPPEPTATAPPTPQPAATPAAAPIALPGCDDVTSESHYCLTLTGSDLALIGLESGDLCPLTSTTAPVPMNPVPVGLAWLGEHVYLCSDDGLVRIALSDGSWEAAGSPCDSVAASDGGLLVYRWWHNFLPLGGSSELPDLAWYPDFEAVGGETYERFYDAGTWWTMTAQLDRLYTAWHSTGAIDVRDLVHDTPAGVLTLEDYDDWIAAISVTSDDHLALIGGIVSDRLVVFDLHDGRMLRSFDLTPSLSGLACVAHGTPRDTPAPTATPTPQSNVTAEPTATPCASLHCPEPCGPPQSVPFELHELPASIANASCAGGRASNYVVASDLLAADAAEELHVIGAYTGKGDPGFRAERQGVIDVVVRPRPKPVALALAAYERTRWRILLEPGATLSRVIVQGGEPQIVDGVPANVPIVQRDPLQSCPVAHRWELDGGGAFSPMIANLRDYTGLVESSFQGCYTADRFDVPHWSGEPPSPPAPLAGDETVANHELAFPGCEHILAESGRCLTTTASGIGLLGMDSGAICPVVASTAPELGQALKSIAWRGEIAYVCSFSEGLIRVSLRDGDWRPTQRGCRAVTTCSGDLLLLEDYSDELQRYSSTSDLLARNPSEVYQFEPWFLSIACAGDRFYGITAAVDTPFAADLATGQVLPSPPLSPVPFWIESFAATDAGELATAEIATAHGPRPLSIYDADSGSLLRTVSVAEAFSGLSCITP